MNYAEKFGPRFWPKVNKDANSGCWEWTGARNREGYGFFGISSGKARGAHRISWMMRFGDIPDGMVICHRCDNPPCVNPDHLFLGTDQDNASDKMSKGRFVSTPGESHWGARLTEEIVRQIRARAAAGEMHTRLAAEFGVTKQNIYRIVSRKTWRHI